MTYKDVERFPLTSSLRLYAAFGIGIEIGTAPDHVHHGGGCRFILQNLKYGEKKMALSDIGLCARALIKIGAAPITSFDDGHAESEIAGALFPQIRDALLSSYAWSFASGQIPLNRLTEAPIADYAYAYQLPNDFLRALSAGNGLHGRGLNFRISGNALHTNAADVILSYIYRPEEETFPPYFDQALIARLAAEFTIPVTENTSRAEAMMSTAEREFRNARQIDAQQDSPNKIDDFTLINVRD